MNLKELLQVVLFSFGDYELTHGNVVALLAVLVVGISIYRLIKKRLLPKYYAWEEVSKEQEGRINRIVRNFFYLLFLIGALFSLELDFPLYSNDSITIKISTILQALLIFQFARLLDWLISRVFIKNYYQRSRSSEEDSKPQRQADIEDDGKASRIVQYIVYVFSIILILRSFQIDYTLFAYNDVRIKISSIFGAILILLIGQFIAWVLTQLILFSYYRRNKVNLGSQYAINQLLRYVIYVIAVYIAIENLGIQATEIWGSAAALLVGVGLGLQQTFNDLISGIILLFERTIEVGDVVEFDGQVGTVRKIGLRTSLVESRENITVVVPNSKLIVESVTNWSHYDDKVRFSIGIGVAYGSDTQKVKELLIEVAKNNIYILDYPMPFVRFVAFADSSLNFELHFWSRNFIVIEDIKSDLRFEIDRVFKENDINIPFPQRVVWQQAPPGEKKVEGGGD